MNMLPYFGVDAVPHNKLPHSTKILYKEDCDDILFVKIPHELAQQFILTELDEIFSGRNIHRINSYTPINLEGIYQHHKNSIWYMFTFNKLNDNIGEHIYRMKLENDTQSIYLFFGYHLTGAPKEKAYKYTKGE